MIALTIKKTVLDGSYSLIFCDMYSLFTSINLFIKASKCSENNYLFEKFWSICLDDL